MLREVMILVRGVVRDGGVRFEGKAGWSEVEEVDRVVIEVDVLDEGERNLIGYGLGKGFRSELDQECKKKGYMPSMKLSYVEIREEGIWVKRKLCFTKDVVILLTFYGTNQNIYKLCD